MPNVAHKGKFLPGIKTEPSFAKTSGQTVGAVVRVNFRRVKLALILSNEGT